jgi:hypothetical protein
VRHIKNLKDDRIGFICLCYQLPKLSAQIPERHRCARVRKKRRARRRSGSDASATRRDETLRCLPWKPDSASVGCFRPSTYSSTVLWLQLAVHHLTHSKPVGVTASLVKFSIPRHIGLLGPWTLPTFASLVLPLFTHLSFFTPIGVRAPCIPQELCQWENHVRRARSHANVGGLSISLG